ncbi:thiosulfate sulfurtransferase-like [Diadema antillarum]|uniref:thiosulfate sulfurtransferase-like n=1 Tax=Diadema antillarum TaxID=105358 RepID=UPI003A85FC29
MDSSEKVEALVSTQWLVEQLRKRSTAEGETPSPSSSTTPSRLCILDATWLGLLDEGRKAYLAVHIPGSLHFDLNQCRDKTSRLEFTLPSPEEFGRYVGGELGIDNDTHVVVYENDPVFRVLSAPRTWWMFRLFGHDKVSVLDGGLKQWQADGQPVESGNGSAVEPKLFTAKPARRDILKSFDQVLDNQKTGDFTMIDSRKKEWFDGSMASIWPGLKLGHIRQTTNVPYDGFIREDNDRLVPPEDMRQVFQAQGVDLSRPIASSCFVGIAACTVALAAYVLGKEDVAVYDGSWDEFSKRAPEDSVVIVPDP